MNLIVIIDSENELQYFGSMTEAIECLKAQASFSRGVMTIGIEGTYQAAAEKFVIQKQIIVLGNKEKEIQLLMEPFNG